MEHQPTTLAPPPMTNYESPTVSSVAPNNDTALPVYPPKTGSAPVNIGAWMISFIHISFEAIIICSLAIYFYKKQAAQQDEISKLKQEMNGLKESVRTLTEEVKQLTHLLNAHLSGAKIVPKQSSVPPTENPSVIAQPITQPSVGEQLPSSPPVVEQPKVVVEQPKVVSAVVEEDKGFSVEQLENDLLKELTEAQKEVDNIRSANSTPKKETEE